MKNVVMGTAGHIDHGKTSLVKKLTGIDTDRLEEEKRRGMTIELGFANLELPSGKSLSIVDVPGHEKFIKSMVAGVSGIDFVVLVIAADEGIMPQTKEHLDILSLLNVKSGVVALTKVDLVDKEWLQMVKAEIQDKLKNTTLKDIKIIAVSSKTGYGVEALVNQLEILTEDASKKKAEEIFRLPIDRIFTIPGHGTVITGTVLGGEIKKGDKISILPSYKESKVRGIQVHNKSVELASAGERCALNLATIEKEAIGRGQVAINNEWMRPSKLMDAVVYTVNGSGTLKHNERVHIHIGTNEVLARVRLLGSDGLKEGSKGYIQLKFEESVVALRGDRFIIRSYSPIRTIAGGKILLHNTQNRGRFTEETLYQLKLLEDSSLKEQIKYLLNRRKIPITTGKIFEIYVCNKEDIINSLKELEIEKKVLKLGDYYLSEISYSRYVKSIHEEFIRLNKEYPYRFQIDREEFKNKLFKDIDSKSYLELINKLVENGVININKNFVTEVNENLKNSIFSKKEVIETLEKVIGLGFNIKTVKQLEGLLDFIKKDEIAEIIYFLVKCKKIVVLGDDNIISSKYLDEAIVALKGIKVNHGEITVVSLRDKLGCGRKAAMAILEYLDSIGVTERYGDIRKLK